jgi:hypothetical protein
MQRGEKPRDEHLAAIPNRLIGNGGNLEYAGWQSWRLTAPDKDGFRSQ